MISKHSPLRLPLCYESPAQKASRLRWFYPLVRYTVRDRLSLLFFPVPLRLLDLTLARRATLPRVFFFHLNTQKGRLPLSHNISRPLDFFSSPLPIVVVANCIPWIVSGCMPLASFKPAPEPDEGGKEDSLCTHGPLHKPHSKIFSSPFPSVLWLPMRRIVVVSSRLDENR